MSDRMPPELWLDIFSPLPRSDIASISLACQHFLTLAQPLLFSSVTFSACRAVRTSRGELHLDSPLSDDDYASLLQKLAFCISLRISPGLMRCVIGPLALRISDTAIGNSEDNDRIDLILSDIFSALPQLINVKQIYILRTVLTPFYISQLSAVPSLEFLILKSCTVTTHELPYLALPKVSLFYPKHARLPPSPFPLWAHTLSSFCLRSLHIAIWDGAELMAELTRMCPWPVLRKLSIATDGAAFRFLPGVLRQCPQLQELYVSTLANRNRFTLDTPGPLFRILPNTVPHLTAYGGPLDTLPTAVSGRAVRHLEISSTVYNTGEIESTLASLGDACVRVETFRATSVRAITPGLLGTIAARCTGIRKLYFTGSMGDGDMLSLRKSMRLLARAQFPPHVEVLHISLFCSNSVGVERTEVPMEEERALRAAVETYRELRDFALDVEPYQLHYNPATGAAIDGNQLVPVHLLEARGFF